MLRIHLILMRIRILDPHWKKLDPDPDPGHFFRFTDFFIKIIFKFKVFFAYFYPETWWTIQKWGNFYNLSFFNSSDSGFRSKKFFLQFLFDILHLGSGSVDPHIFAGPDPDQEAKILRIQRIRMLSTVNYFIGIPLCFARLCPNLRATAW